MASDHHRDLDLEEDKSQREGKRGRKIGKGFGGGDAPGHGARDLAESFASRPCETLRGLYIEDEDIK
jgi:hypothetical protein